MSVVSSRPVPYTGVERSGVSRPKAVCSIASHTAGPMSEKIWFLKRCDLFLRLTPQQKRRLESTAVMRTFRNHEIIYFPTEPGQSVLVLARGRVKLKAIGPEGQET